MPRQYVSVSDFATHPIGIAANVGSLPDGVADKLLFRASARVDRHCRHKFGVPGSTTLANASAVGASALSLTGSLGIDGTPDTLVLIGTGPTQESARVGSLGNIGVAAPYPATLGLFPGVTTQFAHAAGEPVVAYYYEQHNLQGGATNPDDQYFDFTQAGQIAAMHAPRMGMANNVRVFFLKHAPILQVIAYAIAYPWANVLDPGSPSDLFIANAEGWVRLPVGYFAPPDSVAHVTYSAGYLSVPDDVQEAVILEAATELGFGTNYLGAAQFRRGDYMVEFTPRTPARDGTIKNLLSSRAESLLASYRLPLW